MSSTQIALPKYDITQPRVCITSPLCPETYEQRTRELGQAESMGEAMFFLSIGYAVNIARWDGKSYVNSCNYYPEDL